MREAYLELNIQPGRLATIELCNQVIVSYQQQGFRLTLRQLYYQLVARNAIRNEEKAYKNLGRLVSDARMVGLVDWDAIEDRARIPSIPTEFNGLAELAEAALSSYRLPRWQGQEYYVELWVEKDALSGVLAPMARQYHVTLMVNRGYSSQSAMYEAAGRFRDHEGQECILLYLGDHDPSGEDMVRDIADRLAMFQTEVRVTKIALTMAQVEECNPPPNPAKLSDSRASGYIAQHGGSCWEVDALNPRLLHGIVEKSVLQFVDMKKMKEVKKQEELDKIRLRDFVKGL